jgi:glyoxylase-like metal-dependent hydrolase (beta-lactamase superfamily II)
MSDARRRRELARADQVLRGLWRLRLPIRAWPGVPHVNAFTIAAGSGVVLVDTGLHEPGALGQLELALDQAGLTLEHVRLLACTHAHSDHCGLAGPIVDASGCEVWMHPNHAHMTAAAEDPDRNLERRIEIARQAGVPEELIASHYESRRGQGIGVARVVAPDRDLVPGVEIATDLGDWQVYETPGHAPSHVCLHQPERGLLLSGDHLLGRVSLYYDYGYTPDPAGEFLRSLDVVDALDARLCLAGHGRPFRDVHAHVEANRAAVGERLAGVRAALDGGAAPRTAFELVPAVLGEEQPSPMMSAWELSEALCYLRHLELAGHAEQVGDGPDRWALS